jgi:hypothetical protein
MVMRIPNRKEVKAKPRAWNVALTVNETDNQGNNDLQGQE